MYINAVLSGWRVSAKDGRTDRRTYIQTDGQTDRQTDRQTGGQAGIRFGEVTISYFYNYFLPKNERYNIRAINMKCRFINGYLIEVEVCIQTANISSRTLKLLQKRFISSINFSCIILNHYILQLSIVRTNHI